MPWWQIIAILIAGLSNFVERRRYYRNPASGISIGDRMPVSICAVQVHKSDRGALAEEIAPPLLRVRCCHADNEIAAGPPVADRKLECLTRAPADVADHHQAPADEPTHDRRIDKEHRGSLTMRTTGELNTPRLIRRE